MRSKPTDLATRSQQARRALIPSHAKAGDLWIRARRPTDLSCTVSAMTQRRVDDEFGVDANGCLTERIAINGHEVIVHYDDIPDSDITTVDGLQVTTALRTVIDIAPDMDAAELDRILRRCLDRRLFAIDDAVTRIAQPDMQARTGAKLLGPALARQ